MARINGVTLPDVSGTWHSPEAEARTPTAEELEAAEPAVLEQIRQSAPEIFARLAEYRCQYMGFLVRGHRRVYYNFFRCDEADVDDDWRTEPVFVLDGGDDYFHLEYDLDARECVRFYVNGEA